MYDGWERAASASCVGKATNYLARTRAMYSVYNGGATKVCRWTNPNDKWAKNDKNYLDKFGIAKSEMLANIHVARVLLDRAVKAYGEYFKSVNKQIGYDISPYMEIFRMDGVFKWWNEMSEYMTQKVDNTDLVINFNEDENCRLAVKVINDKLSDFGKLNDIIIDGLEENSYEEQK
jgi:hypothetical protein